MEQKYSTNIQPGDLIVVPYNNYLYHAIFKRGIGRSIQFYRLWGADAAETWKKQIEERRHIYVDYINRRGTNVIVKVDPSITCDEVRSEYFSGLSVLRQANLV